MTLCDMDDDELTFEEMARQEQVKHLQLLRRLKRQLSPKWYQVLDDIFTNCWGTIIGFTTREHVRGRKIRGRDYLGKSTPLRYLFADIRGCSYSESYQGQLFLRLGPDRYLCIQVSG